MMTHWTEHVMILSIVHRNSLIRLQEFLCQTQPDQSKHNLLQRKHVSAWSRGVEVNSEFLVSQGVTKPVPLVSESTMQVEEQGDSQEMARDWGGLGGGYTLSPMVGIAELVSCEQIPVTDSFSRFVAFLVKTPVNNRDQVEQHKSFFDSLGKHSHSVVLLDPLMVHSQRSLYTTNDQEQEQVTSSQTAANTRFFVTPSQIPTAHQNSHQLIPSHDSYDRHSLDSCCVEKDQTKSYSSLFASLDHSTAMLTLMNRTCH
jgi:hypothetical protein